MKLVSNLRVSLYIFLLSVKKYKYVAITKKKQYKCVAIMDKK